MDASALGFPRGVTPFLDLPATLDLPLRIPGIPEASLSTGADIVSGAAYDRIEADMVDMETYAVLRACMRFDIPLIALRGISDGAAELRHVADWTAISTSSTSDWPRPWIGWRKHSRQGASPRLVDLMVDLRLATRPGRARWNCPLREAVPFSTGSP